MTREEMIRICQDRDKSYTGKFFLSSEKHENCLQSGVFFKSTVRKKNGLL